MIDMLGESTESKMSDLKAHMHKSKDAYEHLDSVLLLKVKSFYCVFLCVKIYQKNVSEHVSNTDSVFLVFVCPGLTSQ